jgi:PAS domain S-box-containing protein
MAKIVRKNVSRHLNGTKARSSKRSTGFDYAHALRVSRTAIGEVNLKSAAIRWSPDVLEIFGRSPGDSLEELLSCINPDDRSLFRKKIKSLQQNAKAFQIEVRIPLGPLLTWFKVNGEPRQKGRSTTIVLTFQDISIQRNAESDLETWKTRYDLVTASGGIIIYDYDVVTGNIDWTGDLPNVVGFTNRQMGRIEKWADMIHPEDRDEANRLLAIAQERNETYDVSYRFKTLKKGYRYMHDRGMFICDNTGKATRMLGMMNDVSEKVLSELNVKESEKKFRRLIEDIDVGIVVHGPQGDVQMMNKSALAILGVTESELKGLREFATHFQTCDENGVPLVNDDLPAPWASRNYKPVRNITMGITRPHNGEKAWIIVTAEPRILSRDKIDHVVVAITDITERKLMEQALKDSEIRFRTLHQASFGGIGLHKHGLIIDCNQGLCDITGFSYDELIGRNGLTLIAPEFQEMVMNNIRSDYDKPYDVEGIRKDGSRYALEIQGKNIPYKEGATIRVTEFRDISERKYAESQIREQNSRLLAMTRDLQTKNDQLQEFAQIVSHNLRSPVGNILSLLTLIRNAETDEERNEYLTLLEESGTTTLTTLNELNDVLQIKQDKDIEKQVLDLSKVFAHIQRMLSAPITQLSAEITTDFSVPTILYPNIYMESILLNLLSNALKYSSPDRKPKIHVCSFEENGHTCISVSDNGLGINMERYGHQVFKLRKTFHRHPESRGIGLFMIKNQIVALGGEISVISKQDIGSTFTVTFS